MLNPMTKLSAVVIATLLAGCGQVEDTFEEEVYDEEMLSDQERQGEEEAPVDSDAARGDESDVETSEQQVTSDEESAEGTEPLEAPITAEDIGVLALLNDHELTDVDLLDIECAIRSDSARYLVEHRDGADGLPGTDDDNRFATMEDVEGVPMVGPRTIDRLISCADRLGFVPAADEAAMLVMLNDVDETDFHRLDVTCALRSDSASNLIGYRDGEDSQPGTVDDELFDTVDEVESVVMVGAWTIDRLIACAQRAGYAIESGDAGSDGPA